MAGPNPGGGAVAPCKITAVGGDFQVNAADLPVSLTIASNPAQCQFTIAQIVIFDATGKSVDSKPNINATAANLPPAVATLAPGSYDVFVNVSPAAGAPPGNPYNGGEARILENCNNKTLLFIADVTSPTPQFTLHVE
jgi:hypothetical protein